VIHCSRHGLPHGMELTRRTMRGRSLQVSPLLLGRINLARLANCYSKRSQPNILTRSTGCLAQTSRAHPRLCNTSTDATENHTPNSTPACRSLSMKAAALPPVLGVYIAVSHQRSMWHKGHQHLHLQQRGVVPTLSYLPEAGCQHKFTITSQRTSTPRT
jgi:hypothetical protein